MIDAVEQAVVSAEDGFLEDEGPEPMWAGPLDAR
jgi:hypothetical protein